MISNSATEPTAAEISPRPGSSLDSQLRKSRGSQQDTGRQAGGRRSAGSISPDARDAQCCTGSWESQERGSAVRGAGRADVTGVLILPTGTPRLREVQAVEEAAWCVNGRAGRHYNPRHLTPEPRIPPPPEPLETGNSSLLDP